MLILLSVFLLQKSLAVTYITNCTTITEPGEYVLANDLINPIYTTVVIPSTISAYTGAYVCINIQTSNVVLDCNGYNINGTRDAWLNSGVYSDNGISNVTIKNCVFNEWGQGIYIVSGNNVTIYSSIFNHNIDGIHFWLSLHNKIYNSTFINNDDGIYFDSNNCCNKVYNSTFVGNTWGMHVLSRYDEFHDLNITGSWEGIEFDFECTFGSIVYNSYFSNNYIALEGYYGTYNNTIFNSLFLNNYYHIILNQVHNFTIFNNTIIGGPGGANYGGIHIWSSTNNVIHTNIINVPTNPIEVAGSDNLIYNNFINTSVRLDYYEFVNPVTGYVTRTPQFGVNYWNVTLRSGPNIVGGPYIGGNYWADYSPSCNDTDKNGICDEPKILATDPNNIDYLPLATYNPPTTTTIPPVTAVSCRICEPSQIDNYAWRGLCLFGNYVMCNPFFLVIIIILGIIIALVSKLIPS